MVSLVKIIVAALRSSSCDIKLFHTFYIVELHYILNHIRRECNIFI